jgi:hypothetical protein
MESQKLPDRLDLIWGAANIAREINLNTRQTFHHLETGAIPARKVGKKWVAERGQLRDFFLGEEVP